MKHYHLVLVGALCAMILMACGEDKTTTAPAKTTSNDTSAVQNTQVQTTAQPKTDEPSQAQQTDESSQSKPVAEASEKVQPLSLAEGKALYEKTCHLCHDQGLLDAPKISDKAQWQQRLNKGVDTLYLHSAKGFNKMPAQATGDVSEAQVYAAVDYILSQTK